MSHEEFALLHREDLSALAARCCDQGVARRSQVDELFGEVMAGLLFFWLFYRWREKRQQAAEAAPTANIFPR